MKMYSLDWAGTVWPLASKLRLNPLVRTKSVLPSGLSAVESGWPAVKLGRSGRSGFRGWKVEPLAAVAVMFMPVGSTSEAAVEGFRGFDCACDNKGRDEVEMRTTAKVMFFTVSSLLRHSSLGVIRMMALEFLLQLFMRDPAQGIIQQSCEPHTRERQLLIDQNDVGVIISFVNGSRVFGQYQPSHQVRFVGPVRRGPSASCLETILLDQAI